MFIATVIVLSGLSLYWLFRVPVPVSEPEPASIPAADLTKERNLLASTSAVTEAEAGS